MDSITIPEFYHDKEIFITGATGLIGKVVIEKLLRSCATVKKIFILVRNKRGKTSEERIQQITDIPLFDKVKSIDAKSLSKIHVINGDVTALDLGISPEDVERLKNVSVIFHIAASVRFDDRLRDAIIMNTRGTRDLMNLALTMRKVSAVVHVSTSYCNPDLTSVDEKLYPAHGDWRKAIRIAENIDSDILDILTPHFSDHFPNTYTFTKGLAEQVCASYSDRLPIVIYRPAIVSGARIEPLAGWVDNFNGVSGLLVASLTGILRCVYCEEDSKINCIPIDDCVKGMIVASWKVGIDDASINKEIPVYNSTSPAVVKYYDIAIAGRMVPYEIPLNNVVWRPGGFFSGNRMFAYIRILLTMILPAFLLDGVLRIAGVKPFVVSLQRRIYIAMTSLSFFIIKPWDFKLNKFIQMNYEILKADRAAFEFIDIHFVPLEYLRTQVIGARRYLVKEDDSTIPMAKKKLRNLIIIDQIWKYTMISIFVYFVIYPKWVSSYRDLVYSTLFVNYPAAQ